MVYFIKEMKTKNEKDLGKYINLYAGKFPIQIQITIT